ncbi:MAG: ABC transporter substrate-binding protein [Oligoflexia bacterium]|nr:ABC transporter substrate-binding protein [Oligoflexia bacterium]
MYLYLKEIKQTMLVTFIFMIVFSISTIIMPTISDASDEIKNIESKLFIVTEETPPYNFSENNNIVGISTDVVKRLLNDLGIKKYEIHIFSWSRAYGIHALKGLADKNKSAYVLIFSMGRIKEREDLFKWIGVIAPYTVSMYALSERTDINVNNLDDFKKYRVGVVSDDIKSKYLLSKNFNNNNLEYVQKDELNLKKLINKRVDIIPIADQVIKHFFSKEKKPLSKVKKLLTLDDLSSEGLYLAFSKNTPDSVVELFKTTLDKIKKSNEYEIIIGKYSNENIH